jgi:hypothetical protein
VDEGGMADPSEDVAVIRDDILSSPKYRDLAPRFVERVVRTALEQARGDRDDATHRARRELHRAWGAWQSGRPRYDRLLRELADVV